MHTLTIWKYDIETAKRQTISVPKDALFLDLQVQRGTPRVWFMVDPENEREDITLNVFATGELVEEVHALTKTYLGSYQLAEGHFVGHVFAEGNVNRYNETVRLPIFIRESAPVSL